MADQRVERQQRRTAVICLVVAAVLAVVVVWGLVSALRSGSWALVSSAFAVMTGALAQWAAVGARRRGRLTGGGVALLVALGLVGLALCGVDFVTTDRGDRAFTVLFAAGLVAVVGGVLGSYARRPSPPAEPEEPAG